MFRTKFRLGIPVLVLALVLAAVAPAAAAPTPGLWEGVWGWVVSLMTSDRGAGADPNGATGPSGEGDRGLELDPNG